VAFGVAADLGLGRALHEFAVLVLARRSSERWRGGGQNADGSDGEQEVFHVISLRLGTVIMRLFVRPASGWNITFNRYVEALRLGVLANSLAPRRHAPGA